MNRQQYNEEELYQEIMAELDKGAAEYDRMMASGEAPAKKKATAIKWYAVAASFIGLIIMSTVFLTDGKDTENQQTASTEPLQKERHLITKDVAKPQTEKVDNDLYKLTPILEEQPKLKQLEMQQTVSPTTYIYTALLPEVEFCPESNNMQPQPQLPQIRKERSFDLICNVTLPDITAYADSAIFANSTTMMVACDEICYNDSNF